MKFDSTNIDVIGGGAFDIGDNDSKVLEEIISEVINEIIPSEIKLKKKIEMIDNTIEYLSYDLLSNFIKQGVEFGIFPIIAKYSPRIEDIPALVRYPNKKFIYEYIKTALKLKILKYEDEKVKINEEFELNIKMPKFDKIISDYVMKYNFITHISRYALISYNHPKIAISFKKDPDIWDMILSSPYYSLCREIANDCLKIDKGNYLLDVGCGSRSPKYFLEKVFPKGYYMGVDISKGLLQIAECRVKKSYCDSYELKNMDFSDIIPKEKYDYVICSHTLKYAPSLKHFLGKMMSSIYKGGKIFIAEEFILGKNKNICKEVFEFYNKLNKRFRGYYSEEDVKNALELLGYDFKIEGIGNGILVIEKL
ncbi:Methyltransferase type 12 [Methanocaldococcus vulcanius M7]|uniref:Methyltransferase type 12 n=1 Tax=Methanocaldococcus vulcanius (strain ATCC 700851 / DSM 12094 / M7) TaxID=579137 RepID=C9REH3_METVM|nr:methyltransferase domain-containing protein [Methanocaldococcus vulcanius]ACX71975.1 Methyltransferase type 12 [Methanocaldococcus vulcanius M7]